MSGVAADILTGFLGSGKTTLLKHVLEHGVDGKRVAVVMNELGDIDLEGRVITGLQSVEKMVELSSGCICCSIGAQFAMAVREILATVQPHLVIIETTGVAEPEPLIQQVHEAGLSLDAVITVVDAAHGERFLDRHSAARQQVEAADFLVLNKTDLVSEKEAARVERRLKRLNPRALVQRAERGRVGANLLFGTSTGRLRAAAAGHDHAGHDHLAEEQIGAFSWKGAPEENLVRARFERFLARLPADLYRAKGVVRLADEDGAWLFHFTCGRFDLEPAPLELAGDTGSQAVFIGRRVERFCERVLAALERCRPGHSRLERVRAALGAPRAANRAPQG